jgi:hypothetical protein
MQIFKMVSESIRHFSDRSKQKETFDQLVSSIDPTTDQAFGTKRSASARQPTRESSAKKQAGLSKRELRRAASAREAEFDEMADILDDGVIGNLDPAAQSLKLVTPSFSLSKRSLYEVSIFNHFVFSLTRSNISEISDAYR